MAVVSLKKDHTVIEALRLLDRLSAAGRLPPGLLLPWVSRCICRFGADPNATTRAGVSDGAVRAQVFRLRQAIRRNTLSGIETTVFMDVDRFRQRRFVAPGALSVAAREAAVRAPMTSEDDTLVVTWPPTPAVPPPGEEGGWRPSRTVTEAQARRRT